MAPTNTWVRRFLWIVVIVATTFVVQWLNDSRQPDNGADGAARIVQAFQQRQSGVWIETTGRVSRVLADDREGSRHQRFVIALTGGHSVLVAHNIDLAERVPLAGGDEITLRGEYEWNPRGGVLHWTHDDPRGQRAGGWIRHKGRTFR